MKLQRRAGVVTFIRSPDFDTAPEPSVGDVYIVRSDGTAPRRSRPADPCLYHHKWLFVADDYPGVDVETSKALSHGWLALPNVDRSRIGRRSYWAVLVLPTLDGGGAGPVPEASRSRAAN